LTVAVDIAKQITDYLNSGAIVNAVNVPSIDAEARAALQPLLYLADRLGLFLSAYSKGRPSEVEIEYSGDLGVTDTYPITTAILAGFLKPMVEGVNMVSAPGQMKARGIASAEKRSAVDSDYAFEIGVKVVTDQGQHVVKGTLFHKNDPRICSIDGMRVDAKPSGHMLVCVNEDVPLVCGRVCTVIGESGVNIANLTLGRAAKGGQALIVFNLDQKPSDATLDNVRKLAHVKDVGLVVLPETVS